jgi:hypothetical protein
MCFGNNPIISPNQMPNADAKRCANFGFFGYNTNQFISLG